MATGVKRRGGTTVQHASFTGLNREITVDDDRHTIRVHNGVRAGGFELARSVSVLAFGAKGDGMNDDGPAFKSAMDAAVIEKLGRVEVPETGSPYVLGTVYNVTDGSLTVIGKNDAQPFATALIAIPNGVELVGVGKPTLRAASNMMVLSGAGRRGFAMIANRDSETGGHDIAVRNLILDGNVAGQGVTPTASEHWRQEGVMFYRCFNCEAENVTVQNTCGDHLAAEEAFGFRADLSVDIRFVRCHALATGGSGFAVNHSFRTKYSECVAEQNLWNGFTDNASLFTRNAGVNNDIGGAWANSYVWYDGGLWAGTTATDGPLKYNSQTIYKNCHAARNGYSGQGTGFNVETASVIISGCSSRKNLGGWAFVANDAINATFIGCIASDQVNGFGILASAANLVNVSINGCTVVDCTAFINVFGAAATKRIEAVGNRLMGVTDHLSGAQAATVDHLVYRDNNFATSPSPIYNIVRIGGRLVSKEDISTDERIMTTDIAANGDRAMHEYKIAGTAAFRLGQTATDNDGAFFLESLVAAVVKKLIKIPAGTTELQFPFGCILGWDGTTATIHGSGAGVPAFGWPQGSTWCRTDGTGAGEVFYVKSSVGWVAL